jgi:hypothetical protein
VNDPEETPTESESEQRPRPPAKILPFAVRPRPEWLTGPADDVLGADADTTETPVPARAEPILMRPGLGARTAPEPQPVAADEPHAERDDPGTSAGQPEAKAGADATPHTGAWAPAASSIPVLRMPLPDEPAGAVESPSPGESEGPKVGRPRGLPGGDEDRKVVPPPVAVEPLREAWWLVAADALRSDWRVQSAVAAALLGLAVLAYALWPHGMDSTSIRSMRLDPRGFDGRTVLVRGRAGDDVFSVGSGWAFYLTQGRDTIVAFTRTRAPSPHEVVSLKGTVSTGFLDGQPRQALFEAPATAK